MMASCLESAIVYGAETRNAHLAKNSKAPGTIKNVHPAVKPWGPGLGLHIFRNVIATAGLRMFSMPCTYAIETATGKSNPLTTLGGDFGGNVIAACMSAVPHQMYNFTVTTPE